MTTMLVENVRSLTEFEPCDKCGNRSYFIATKDGSDLTFCAHHGSKFEPGLIAAGFHVDDQTHLLTDQI